jgi:hypothetical protein
MLYHLSHASSPPSILFNHNHNFFCHCLTKNGTLLQALSTFCFSYSIPDRVLCRSAGNSSFLIIVNILWHGCGIVYSTIPVYSYSFVWWFGLYAEKSGGDFKNTCFYKIYVLVTTQVCSSEIIPLQRGGGVA